MEQKENIDRFLALDRFAMIGVSRNAQDFSRGLMREFMSQGYEVVPINPFATEIEGLKCYPSIVSVDADVTAALLMIPKTGAEKILYECAEANISLLWLYGISGVKDIKPSLLRLCEELKLTVIPGFCPYMMMPTSGWFHRVHGSVWKVLGKYPR